MSTIVVIFYIKLLKIVWITQVSKYRHIAKNVIKVYFALSLRGFLRLILAQRETSNQWWFVLQSDIFSRRILEISFDTMVTFIILVITTLVILSSVSIVSTQDELEHHLAIDCEDKGTYMIIWSFSFEKCIHLSIMFQVAFVVINA